MANNEATESKMHGDSPSEAAEAKKKSFLKSVIIIACVVAVVMVWQYYLL
jgi:hypothetical protein